MTRQKKQIYALALLLSLLLLGLYAALSVRSSQKASQELLQTTLQQSAEAMCDAVASHSRSILFELDAYADMPLDEVGAARLLQELEAAHPGQQFDLADRTGAVTDSSGQPAAGLDDLAPLREARSNGFAVIPRPEAGGSVAYIVPLPGHSARYLLQIEPIDAFERLLEEVYPLDASYATVFRENGTPVSGFFWGDADGSYELAQSVQHGATDYLSGEQGAIQRLPLHTGYNLYVPLEQPQRWFVGARVPVSAAASGDAGLLYVHLLLLPVWAVSAAFVLALDLLNDRRRRESLTTLGNLDPLTKLTNGAGMEQTMMDFFREHPIHEYSLVVMDIVAFHRVNALYGHAVGDSLLCLVAGVLQKHTQCPARMYGDVFAFLGKTAPDLVSNTRAAIDDAMNSGFGKPYCKMIHIKFGVYPILSENHSFRQIIDGAQLALRDAKKAPNSTEVVYDLHLQRSAQLKRSIEANMLHALSQREFVVYIQPKFRVLDDACCGGEALVRWQSPELGLLMPNSFVPLFEDNGFIVEIDLYMLQRVMDILRRQLDMGMQPVPLSVNMSRVTIAFPTFLERLEDLVRHCAVPLQYLELEITETALEDDHDLVVHLMHALRGLGFTVSLDDFGSGFSSLTSLRDLPVDVLKIDRAFFQETDASNKSRKIIQNILNMAGELEIRVVCEGVESKQQVEFLRRAGDIVAQGYYYSKPVPFDEFEKAFLVQRSTV